jgi:Transposase, Mutator family
VLDTGIRPTVYAPPLYSSAFKGQVRARTELVEVTEALTILPGMHLARPVSSVQELDGWVEEFRNRPLDDSYPYVWLDAIYLKVRPNHRIVRLCDATRPDPGMLAKLILKSGLGLREEAHGNRYGIGAITAIIGWAKANIQFQYLRYPVDNRNHKARGIPRISG